MLREFKKLMCARFFFTLASTMQAVVVGWQIYKLTHNPLDLGLIGLTAAVPALSVAMYAGYMVDRSRPLLIYKWVLCGSFLSAAVLFISQLAVLHWSISQQIFGLFLSSFVVGGARGFSQPALFSIVPKLVPREQLAHASAWTGSVMQVARISGPAVAGLVFGWFGIEFASLLILISLSFALVAVSMIALSKELMKIPTKEPGRSDIKRVIAELFSGAVFIFKDPILLPAMSLDMISVFFGGVTALLPIFADDVLHIGSQGLGTLRAAPALGAMILSFWLTRFDFGKRAGVLLFCAVAGFGFSIVVFALSHNFALSLVALVCSGACDSVSVVVRSSAVQLSSPDRLRGKISAVNSMFIGSSNEIGEFESGVAASIMGTVPSAVFGGVMCLATVLIVAWRAPFLRKLDLRALAAKRF